MKFKAIGRLCILSTSIAITSLWISGCSDKNPTAPKQFPYTAEFDSEVPATWFDLEYDLVKAEKYSPPVASRIYAYTGIALYESVVNGMSGYHSLSGQLHELQTLPAAGNLEYHWPTVANSAMATVMRGLFENGSQTTQDSITEQENQFEGQFEPMIDADILNRSIQYGREVGEAILGWSRTDGFESLHNCSFTSPVGQGLWEPTPPAYAQALEPCWGQLRTFIIDDGSECDPGPLFDYSEDTLSSFYQEAIEVYNTVEYLTNEQMDIALYWADGPGATGTPPGHSISILSQIIRQNEYRLDVAAEAYAKVGIAVGDAFIACWWTKYQYNLLRPITYIRKLVDPEWLTPITTPPFPECTSGHSVQSGAAAQVLTDLFGNVAFTDHTHDDLGFAPRSFNNFFEFANEAAISRLYGGIHYRTSIDQGVEQGKCIGTKVSGLNFRDDVML